jgi:hypothetical protein
MKRYSVLLALGVATLLTVLSGFVQGRLSNRWGISERAKQAGAKLNDIPSEIGKWKRVSSASLPDYAQRELEATGSMSCVYRNTESGERISVTLLVGPPGKIAAHTPDVCLDTQGHPSMGKAERIGIEEPGYKGADQELWAETFKGKGIGEANERFYWGWSNGGPWSAPNSRWQFVGSPHLYKIQLSRSVDSIQNTKADKVVRDFLSEFLPVLRRDYMVSASSPK